MDEKLLVVMLDGLKAHPVALAVLGVLALSNLLMLPFLSRLGDLLADKRRIERARSMLELRKLALETMAVMKERGVSLPANEEEGALAPWRTLLSPALPDVPGKSPADRRLNALVLATVGFGAPFLAQIAVYAVLRLFRVPGPSGTLGVIAGVVAVAAALAAGWMGVARLARRLVGDAGRFVSVGAVVLIGYEVLTVAAAYGII